MRRWLLLDSAVLVLLITLPALGLIGVYGSWSPVLVWGSGALLAGLLSLLVAALRWPAWVAVPLTALAALVLGPSLVGLRPVLPSGAQIAALARGAVSGWRELLSVAVPVGPAPGLLTPMLLTGVICGSAATVVARTRWFPAALLPVLTAGLVAGLLGATQVSMAVLVVLTAVPGLAGLGWVAVRRAAGRFVVGPPSTRWRRPVTAAVLLTVAVGCGVAVLNVPAAGDRLALRETLVVPVDPATLPSPLSEFRHLSVDRRDEVLFSVTGVAAGERLRLAALDSYDGKAFTATAAQGPFARIGTRRVPAATGAPREVAVTVRGWQGAYLPLFGELESVGFTGPRGSSMTDAFRYSPVALTGLIAGGVAPGDGWRQRGVPAPAEPSAAGSSLMLEMGSRPATAPIPDPLRAAAQQWTEGADGPAEQLAALTKALSDNGYYSQGREGQLRSPSGHGLNRLLEMTSGAVMVGDAEQYSALLAVLARSLGIPARVVVGFAVPAEVSGTAELTGAQLTAWVEVRFTGAGWVAYDPTPPADRTDLTTQPRTQAGRHVVDNQPPPPPANGDSAQVQAGDSTQRPDRGQQDSSGDPAGSGGSWWRAVILGALGLLLVLLLPALLILLVKRYRRAGRARLPDPAARTRAAWRELLDTALDTRLVLPAQDTRAEVAGRLESLGVSARRLADWADRAQFSPQPAAGVDADAAWRLSEQAGAELLARLSRADRWRARISLASLRSKGAAQPSPGSAGPSRSSASMMR